MSKNIMRKYALLGAVSSIAITSAPALYAQSTGSGNDFVFEEIVVTAGRREQNLQDVPAAVTAIDPSDFTVKGFKGVGAIFDYTAGVSYSDQGVIGQGSVTARGVSQSQETPVFGVYLDDTPVSTSTGFAKGSSVFFDAMLMDIERIEIIKGPQGTLYGATSVGGMMRYISRDPALEEFRASAGADASTTKDGEWSQTYNGRVSMPIVEGKLGLTLSSFYRDIGGYVDYADLGTGDVTEDVDGAEVYGYAADVIFKPTEALEIRLKYLKQKTDYPLLGAVYLAGPTTDEGLVGDYATIDAVGDNSIDYEIATGSISYDLGWGEASSTTSYVKYEVAGVNDYTALFADLADLLDGRAPGTTTAVDFTSAASSKKYVQEVRLTSERMGAFEWIAGLYYTNEDTENFQSLQATPALNLANVGFPSKYEEYAAFADVTYYISDNFDVTAGMRLSHNSVDLVAGGSGVLVGESNEILPSSNSTVDTYLFSARYRPAEEISIYTRVASGYRPRSSSLPAVDPITGDNLAPPFMESDSVWSYEIGAKGSLADNMFSYDLALWKIDWSKFQTAVSINGVSVGGNAADGVSGHGFEGAFIIRPVANFTMSTNFAYSKSTLNADEPLFGGAEGDLVPNVPKWTWSVQADYGFDVASEWMANIGGGLRYVGEFETAFSNPAGEEYFSRPSQNDSRLVADMNFSISKDNLSIGLYANNLFNTRSLIGRTDYAVSVGGTSTGVFERPRTIGVNFNVDF
ncbi:TonB-dependent receptor [Kordiimonas pumila]|uniref:TonB-dependent receptor n=1 Tax=Kordiimonas pumila TaxID=2161677 RepID=A0ABV7D5F8_9PROT|nr:TonB-dependent receptor [Kordiimonas pumila]